MLRDAFNIWSVTDMGYAFLLQKCLFYIIYIYYI